jgi:hypothetical protein
MIYCHWQYLVYDFKASTTTILIVGTFRHSGRGLHRAEPDEAIERQVSDVGCGSGAEKLIASVCFPGYPK